MPHSSLSPISVVDYGRDYIIEFVRYITGWNERDEVTSKSQLSYLCGYLESDHIACKTIVIESDYVERHYLEDYAEYYARCFPAHPRRCSRLHFFSSEFDESTFTACLAETDKKFTKTLKDNYLGFAVIRPITHTVFARICLRPYPALLQDRSKKILTRQVDVLLFGLKLSVHTVPFIEQDKVVSACATSALWVALSANADFPTSAQPSPSAITKAATQGGLEAGRTFPTAGLSPTQILRGLRHFGLEPSIVWSAGEDPLLESPIRELQANIYSYLSNETAVILGGEMYRKNAKGRYEHLGAHLVCVTGYSVAKTNRRSSNKQKFVCEDMDKLYVHDDRCGPYLRLRTKLKEFTCGKETWQGMELAVHGLSSNLLVPTIAIVGLYHKIRIPYSYIRGTCEALHFYLKNTSGDLSSFLKTSTDRQSRTLKPSLQAIDTLLKSRWEITLLSSTRLKQEITSSDDFIAFNGSPERQTLLVQNMPRFLWRCRILDTSENPLTDILFDATEVPQGNTLVGYIARHEIAVRAWHFIHERIQRRQWQSYKVDDGKTRELIGCFFKFFLKGQNDVFLNTSYGPMGLPRRSLKPGETDHDRNIANRGDIFTVRRGEQPKSWRFLEREKKYIWVINDVGDIVIGEDIGDGANFLGHPTLIDGKPGRIAGELMAVPKEGNSWIVNARSRAYSAHVRGDVMKCQRYLQAVIDNNLPGLDVTISD